jgi:PBSX family phage terminase large subunit
MPDYMWGSKAKSFIRRSPRDEKWITILNGSVRSGKTWAMSAKILRRLVPYPVSGMRVVLGKSKSTVYDNVLRDLFEFAGPENVDYRSQSGELTLCGQEWKVIGIKDKGSEEYLRGKTIGIAVVDEATLMPEPAWNQLLARMSPTGARLYCTTNPDTPYHYLKKKFIDEPKLLQDITCEDYFLDDNLSLSEETKDRLKRSFTGVFYERFILGRWVIAEGAIYKDSWSDGNLFDDASIPMGLLGPGGHVDRFIAVDYGTTNQCVFLDIVDDGRTLWVVREYVWDSASQYRQKTDAQYADDLQDFMRPAHSQSESVHGTLIQGANVFGEVIIDPSAASFKAELLQRGIFHTDANNEVLDGIRVTASLMAQKKLKVHRNCTNLITQLQTYAWNEKAAKRGEEEPLKVNDHGPDACRYGVATKIPAWRLAA